MKKLEKTHPHSHFMSNKCAYPNLEAKLACLLAEAKVQKIDIQQFLIKNFENDSCLDQKKHLKHTIKVAIETLEQLLSKNQA